MIAPNLWNTCRKLSNFSACKDKYPQKIKQKALSDILKSQALSASSKTCYN